MTVYSSAAWTPATTSPVLTPMRRPTGAPPPRSSSSTRRTARCIASAARTARSGSSSWATGAPKTAMMPSPVSLSTCPPKVRTAPASAASTRSVTAPTRSGSTPSDHAVKSERSPKSTVTTRRSAAGEVAAAGQRRPAVVAEAGVRHRDRAADRAGHGALRSGRAGASRAVQPVGRAQVPGQFPAISPRYRPPVEVGQLGPHRAGRGRPQRAVHVGVDDRDDLARSCAAPAARTARTCSSRASRCSR